MILSDESEKKLKGVVWSELSCSMVVFQETMMGLLQLLKSQFLCLLIMCYVFLVSGLVVNLLQLCTLPLWLINKQLARRINIRLAYCISSRKYQLLLSATQMTLCFLLQLGGKESEWGGM